MRVSVSVLATVVAALLLGPAAAPARAATDAGPDPARDQLSQRADAYGPPTRPEKTHRAGDIVDNSVSFGTDITVTTRYRAFATNGYTLFTWNFKTVDQKGPPYWSATLEVRAGRDHGVFTLADPIANPVDCGGAVLDPTARTVTLTLPATCLNSPAWVKVGNGSTVLNGVRVYSDDARLDGIVKERLAVRPQAEELTELTRS